MRVLVINYHFPPDGSVGGLRWAGITKYLARRGWDVHVVTTAPQANVIPTPGVSVHAVPPRRTANDRYREWRGRSHPGGSTPGTVTPSAGKPAAHQASPHGVIEWFRANVGATLTIPDEARGWMLRAAGTAKRLLDTMPFDAVITSGPPHSVHIAGLMALRGKRIPIFMDLRDPWAPPPGEDWGTDWRKRYGVFRHGYPYLERMVLGRAAGIVTNTAGLAEIMRRRLPRATVSYIPSGIDRERLPAPATTKFEGLSIAYVGTLYFNRNLSSVVAALAAFFKSHPEAIGALRLRIAGNMQATHASRFRTEIADAGIGESVEFLGLLPGTAALDVANRSHLLLVLAQRQPLQVPAKLYECVAMGVPTLVITESTSAAAEESRRIGAMARDEHDIDGITKVIESLWANPGQRPPPAASSFDYDGVAAQIDAMLRGRPPAS